MSSYYQSTLTYGLKVSKENEDKLTGIKFPNYISIQNTGLAESENTSTIIGITFGESFLDEDHALELYNISNISEQINSKQAALLNDIQSIFDKFDIIQDIELNLYLTSYLY